MKPGPRTCWVKCPVCGKFHRLNLSQFSKRTPLTTKGLFCQDCFEESQKDLLLMTLEELKAYNEKFHRRHSL